jgi:hypothetical protein
MVRQIRATLSEVVGQLTLRTAEATLEATDMVSTEHCCSS